MSTNLIFALNTVGVLVAFGLLVGRLVWPRLRGLPTEQALGVLIVPHTFRFLGLSFLVPGVVSTMLPAEFAKPVAWGDFSAAVIALVAIAAISRGWRFRLLFVWLLNIWGPIDLIYSGFNAARLHLDPGLYGAAYYIVTVWVPLLL